MQRRVTELAEQPGLLERLLISAISSAPPGASYDAVAIDIVENAIYNRGSLAWDEFDRARIPTPIRARIEASVGILR